MPSRSRTIDLSMEFLHLALVLALVKHPSQQRAASAIVIFLSTLPTAVASLRPEKVETSSLDRWYHHEIVYWHSGAQKQVACLLWDYDLQN